MTSQNAAGKSRGNSRFTFVSRVRYVMHPDLTGEEFEGFASDVSIGGLCLTQSAPLAVGQEILVKDCILPYCRKVYRVRWTEATGSGTYRAGLVRIDDSAA